MKQKEAAYVAKKVIWEILIAKRASVGLSNLIEIHDEYRKSQKDVGKVRHQVDLIIMKLQREIERFKENEEEEKIRWGD